MESRTVNEFCARQKISRSELYKAWRQGKGPRYFEVGTHKRISDEAEADWVREREREVRERESAETGKAA
jgi:hypothetical protein